MNNYSFTNNGKTYKRITKRRARTLFNHNHTIFVSPSKLRPFGFWGGTCEINNNELRERYFENSSDVIFEKFCNEFTYYNCNSEVGKYISFYIEA